MVIPSLLNREVMVIHSLFHREGMVIPSLLNREVMVIPSLLNRVGMFFSHCSWVRPTKSPLFFLHYWEFNFKSWFKKNGEVFLPEMAMNHTLPFEEWLCYNLPSHEVLEKVVAHVDTQYWHITRVANLQGGFTAINIMFKVLDQLVNGADSLVGPPG